MVSLAWIVSCSRAPVAAPAAEKEAGEEHPEKHLEAANVIEMSLEAQRRAGIEVAPAASGRVQSQLSVTGTVQPVDTRVVEVRPLAHGRLQGVFVKVGDCVEKDQPLAEFDNIQAGELISQINSAQAELQRLKIQSANAMKQADRTLRLAKLGAAAAREAESAEAEAEAMAEAVHAQESAILGLKARLKRFGLEPKADPSASLTTLVSPFAGVVVRMEAAPGDAVEPSTILFSVADLSRVYVEARVYEKDLGRIRAGQPAYVTVEAYPDQRLPARVVAIKDILDKETRTAAVRCELANPDGKLKLEMFAAVVLPTSEAHQGLSLPHEAVHTVNRRRVVFVRQDSVHFEVREVKILGDGDRLEIIGGLKLGEPVVVRGAFQLKSVYLSRELKTEHGEHD
jgi:cobalt-zinc-cadmium efflux system membrane fusion protein